MMLNRRQLVGAAAALPLLATPGVLRAAEPDLSELRPITGDAVPIGTDERAARVAAAQRLMRDLGIGALVIEPGASLVYFTGVRWGRSERLTAAVIPVEGPALIVTPFFEEPSVRESLAIAAEVRVWQEDESPLKLVAAWLTEKKLHNRAIAFEETVRFFVVDALRGMLPEARQFSGNAFVRDARMRKSPAEIALMQKANDVTLAAYRWTWPRIEKGMTPADIGALMNAATRALGGRPEFALVLLGEAAAYPHGTGKPQAGASGEPILMDCGCTVEGYQSDISRTFVKGSAPRELRRVWDQVRAGQMTAFAAAQLGATAGSVDDAVRRSYEAAGYGPRYALPGLSHRTGHGIGLDGHEPVNLVHGELTRLAPGMCFSNEPGIYAPGKFGVRLEDCFHMTEAGPQWFSEPPPSLDAPLG